MLRLNLKFSVRFVLIVLTVLFLTPATTGRIFAATAYQKCLAGTSCVVGEYLYNDSYVPITGATCTFTSRNPDGSLFVSSAAMTSAAENDGWYSYAVDTTGKDNGIYRSQVCCTSGAEYMCLDKTYEIGTEASLSSSDVTSAVWDASVSAHTTAGTFGANLQSPAPSVVDIWGYSDRSLTSFGSLISDMWSYSTRSLSSFSNIVTAVWSNATRTLTEGVFDDGSKIATQNDVQVATNSAVVTINANSDANTSALSSDIAGVQSTANTINGKVDTLGTDLTALTGTVNTVNSTVNTINTNVNTITTNLATISTNVDTLLTKWGSYSATDIITNVGSIQTNIGSSGDGCAASTLFGYAHCAKDKWGVSSAEDLLTATNNVATLSAALRAELNYNGKSTTAYEDLQTLLGNLTTVTSNLGTVASNVTTISTNVNTISTNVLGVDSKIDTLTTKVDSLTTTVDGISTNVSTLLTKWGSYSITDVLSGITTVQNRIGTNADTCLDTTVFGYIACINDNGANSAAILTAATNAATQSAAIRAELNYNGKSTTAYEDLQSLLTNLGSLTTNVSTVSTNVNSIATNVNTVSTNLNTVATNVTGVDTKLTTLTNKVDALTVTLDGIASNVDTLISKWGSYSMSDVITSTTTIQTRIGSSSNVCGDLTVFGYISCIDGSGGNSAAILAAAETAASQATAVRAELDFNGKSSTAYSDLQTLKTNMTTIQSLIGTSSDTSAASSLFGSIKKTQEQISVLDTSGAGLTDLLSKWGSYSATDIYDKVKDLSSKIDSVNTISNVSSILTLSQANSADINGLKNSALELVALTQANKRILEDGKNVPIITSWLEEGSIIFKTLITNPSSVRHDIPIKFYLPKEASLQDVMKIDKELTTAYDPAQDALYVSGQFTLGPGETKIVAIEMTDIWKISPQETASLRLQAQELFEPLKNTAFFAQGATLKSDVTAALDTADQVQAEAQTPEARIKAYRAAVVEVNRAKEDIANLKSLVTQASSSGTLVGFVGGVQTLAVWGLVIILTTGFVFLALYMRMLTVKQKGPETTETSTPAVHRSAEQTKSKLPMLLAQLPLKKRWHLYAAIAGYLSVVAVIAVSFFFVAKSKHWFSQSSQANTEAANTVEASPAAIADEESENQQAEDLMLSNEKQVLGASVSKELVTINAVGNGINMRELPDSKAKIVKIFHKDTAVEKLDEQNGWVNVSFDPQNGKEPMTGWISQEFIESMAAAETSP